MKVVYLYSGTLMIYVLLDLLFINPKIVIRRY